MNDNSPEYRIGKTQDIIAAKLDPLLHQIAGERMGFCLVVFPIGRMGEVKTVSNVKRMQFESVLASMLDNREEFFVESEH